MLAPLENRSLIERASSLPPEERVAQLEADNLALHDALRQSRQAHKRSTTLAASKIIAQDNEISRLETLYRAARERLATLESGVAVGQFNHRLRTLSAANEQLANATRTIEMLDDSLRAARDDWARLARERELAIMDLASDARHLLQYRN